MKHMVYYVMLASTCDVDNTVITYGNASLVLREQISRLCWLNLRVLSFREVIVAPFFFSNPFALIIYPVERAEIFFFQEKTGNCTCWTKGMFPVFIVPSV